MCEFCVALELIGAHRAAPAALLLCDSPVPRRVRGVRGCNGHGRKGHGRRAGTRGGRCAEATAITGVHLRGSLLQDSCGIDEVRALIATLLQD